MDCLKCSTANTEHAKFCKACGFNLKSTGLGAATSQPERTCNKCKAPNALTAKFCKACGAPFSEVAKLAPLTDSAVEAPVFVPPRHAAITPSPKPATAPPPVSQPEAIAAVQPVVATSSAATAATMPVVSPTAPRDLAYRAEPPLSARPARSVASPTSLPPKLAPTITKKSASTKTVAPKNVMVLGGLVALILIATGAGSYWIFGGKSKPASELADAKVLGVAPTADATAAQANSKASEVRTALPVVSPVIAPAGAVAATAAVAAETPTPAPSTVAAPVVPVIEPPASPAPPSPTSSPKPLSGDASASVASPETVAQDKRKAEQTALKKRSEREALALQREQDKAKLKKTNRTLDDLLK